MHVQREGNQAGDFLAKLGAMTMESLRVRDRPPTDMELNLLSDLAGVVHMR